MAKDSAIHAYDLAILASSQFGRLSEAEQRLLLAAPRGEIAICGPNVNRSDPANDPKKAEDWSKERDVRAELIRWLCTGEISKKVDPRGLLLYAAKITHGFDLSFATVPFPIRLARCRFANNADFSNLSIPALHLNGCSIGSLNLESADVRGSVFFRDGFSSVGGVRLSGSRIGGVLFCGPAVFNNPGGIALTADQAEVKGSVLLTDSFLADGGVSLVGARIGRDLICEGASFKHPSVALSAEGAEIGGNVYFREGFFAVGEVRLLSTKIGGDLNCRGGVFKNEGSLALTADGVEVKGSVFLNNGFSADGEVRLPDAVVTALVICDGGKFMNRGMALNLENIRVGGNVFLRDGFNASGGVNLGGAQIGGGLSCSGGEFAALSIQNGAINKLFSWYNVKNPVNVFLDLRNASAGAIEDDEPSWPSMGHLFLDGFVYGRIRSGPTDWRKRLYWLDRQKDFRPQPYRQLAKILHDLGDEPGAKRILFELDSRASAEGRRRLVRWPIRWLLESSEDAVLTTTIGYGIYPERALWYLIGLTALGWVVHRRAQRAGAMAPTDREAYAEFHRTGQPPAHYQPFSPLIYSIENCVPLVKLGQDERWQPDPNPRRRVTATGPAPGWRGALQHLVRVSLPERTTSPVALRWFRWIMIGLGWVLATFFVAGLTGIIKTN